MVMNLSSGGAAVNVFARQHGIAVTVVDVGVATPLPPLQGVRRARVADGSADLSVGPAMTRDQAIEGARHRERRWRPSWCRAECGAC